MGVMRWPAEADATITNAWVEGLTKRGEAANTGLADSVEVFVIHGQAARTGADSKELARILLRINVTKLRESLDAGNVPLPNATNKPKYYLRMFNAKHPETLPKNFTLNVHALSNPFDEGTGIDMSEYSDVGAASWSHRTNTAGGTGVGTITVTSNPTEGTEFTVKIDTEVFYVVAAATPALTKANIIDEINNGTHASNTASKIVTASDGGGSKVTITADAAGSTGNYAYSVSANDGRVDTANYYMANGSDYTAWGTAMNIDSGDYAGAVLVSQEFETGEEDLMVDITSHIEALVWDGSLRTLNNIKTDNKGLIIKVSTENIGYSVYTKKFFARSSEYFFKRPCLEARWDSSTKDGRARFFAESSLLSNQHNTQYAFLYNSVDGEKSNYNLGGKNIYVRFYTDPDYTQLASIKDANDGYAAANFVQATNPATGSYQAAITCDTTKSTIYDMWYAASAGAADESTWTVIHKGAIDVKQRTPELKTKKDRYVFSITNLKKSYSRSEQPRFRVYTRLKDWSPTIYTVARGSLQNKIVDNVYFKIFRVVDDEVLFDYGRGTATTNSDHTLLSYDSEGSYFDFDMSLLEAGYMYGIRFMTSIDGELREQEEIFKFRVD